MACAELLLAEGASVSIIGRNVAGALDVAMSANGARFPGALRTIEADLGSYKSFDDLGDALEAAGIVVNNAGAIPGGSLASVDEAP
ncbi:hypothetical protein D9M68_69700 [compost metagenome]